LLLLLEAYRWFALPTPTPPVPAAQPAPSTA
jgi:hypothetical protein